MAARRTRRAEVETSSSESSTSHESLAPSLKIHIPVRASKWKLGHLHELGIFYDEKYSNLEEIMSHLKKHVEGRGIGELPEVSKRLVDVVKKIWTFSIDFSEKNADAISVGVKDTDEMIDNFDAEDEILKKQFSRSRSEERLYSRWSSKLIDFWGNLRKFLAKWTTANQRQARFTHLFRLFSGISLLDPESGDDFKGNFQIKGVTVHGFPDVRFNSFPDNFGVMKLVVVTEVKLYDALSGEFSEETFSANNITGKVLGQHGIELLMERDDSFFAPGIAGIICMGTKIVFTYLYIKEVHLSKIQEKGCDIDESYRSTIMYTRPFDFMDVRDRNEILESFFWFGFVQSSSYKAFHL